jgi:hypothetical protein
MLSAISSRSDQSSGLLADAGQAYDQWNQSIPVSYKVQNVSLNPFIKTDPKLDYNNDGSIYDEPNEDSTTGNNNNIDQLNKKLENLKDGILNNEIISRSYNNNRRIDLEMIMQMVTMKTNAIVPYST